MSTVLLKYYANIMNKELKINIAHVNRYGAIKSSITT